jgi:hypothetical protein
MVMTMVLMPVRAAEEVSNSIIEKISRTRICWHFLSCQAAGTEAEEGSIKS